MNNASPPLSFYGLYSCSVYARRETKGIRVPSEEYVSPSPPTGSASLLLFVCGSSDREGQLWSKIYLQNLIRQFSQSLLLGRCGPGGARTEDGRQEETQLSIADSRRERL